MVPGLTFKSLIYFMLIFLYGVREWSSSFFLFFFLYAAVWFPSTIYVLYSFSIN